MTASQLLTRLRTLLDEDIAQFWSDSECYSAFTDAQIEIIKRIYNKWILSLEQNPNLDLPITIRNLFTTTTQTLQTGTSFSLPSTLLNLLSIKVDSTNSGKYFPAIKRPQNQIKHYIQDNPYLVSTKSDIYYDIQMPNIIFETALANGNVVYDFLIKPNDIDGTVTPSVDPTIDSIAHEAIIYFAWFILLSKAKLPVADALASFEKIMESL